MKTDRADMDLQTMSPLCTYGRDEQYIMNKLWLNGVSTIILDGVGDGMVVWCALQKRIPIMCLYDREIHKKTIEAFLQEKILKKMTEATPKDTRWYRTAAQLGCREDEHEEAAAVAKKAVAAAKVKAAVAAVAVAAPKAKAPVFGVKHKIEKASDGEESSSDESSSKKKLKTGVEPVA